MSDTIHQKIHESGYGTPFNFHVAKHGDEVHVVLTYPPWTDADNKGGAQCRYVRVNQESVRASDSVRLHYDYGRNGFVVEQPRPKLVAIGINSYEDRDDWTEVGFFPSWRLNDRENGEPSLEDYEQADLARLQGERKGTP